LRRAVIILKNLQVKNISDMVYEKTGKKDKPKPVESLENEVSESVDDNVSKRYAVTDLKQGLEELYRLDRPS
jgi:hypothetical protein